MGSTLLFGTNNVGISSVSPVANRIYCCGPYYPDCTGTLTQFTAQVNIGKITFAQLAIYSDIGGGPGTMLARTANVGISTYTTVFLSAPPTLQIYAGTPYWFAIQYNNSVFCTVSTKTVSGITLYQWNSGGSFAWPPPSSATSTADTSLAFAGNYTALSDQNCQTNPGYDYSGFNFGFDCGFGPFRLIIHTDVDFTGFCEGINQNLQVVGGMQGYIGTPPGGVNTGHNLFALPIGIKPKLDEF